MNWKNWPYWVKGGVIGFIISVTFFVVKLQLTTSDVAPPICDYVGSWEIIGKPCSATEFIIINYKQEIIITAALLALLGYLYGKIKTRNTIRNS